VYPDENVASFVTKNFIPVRIHVKEQPQNFERFGAQWTPTILILDADGAQRHKIEGFLPAGELLGQLELGLAHAAFARNDFADAEQRFGAIATGDDKDVAPEAIYWSGVSRYKRTNDASALVETNQKLSSRFPESSWTKKASVWQPQQK
jgi:hypothetical protein